MTIQQVVIIGKRSFPITYGSGGPTITGVFTPEQRRYITQVYGVRIMAPSDNSKPPKR
jgi:hypothetical protein